MGFPKIKELSQYYIQLLESGNELSKRDRHTIALLLFTHTLQYRVERKIVSRKAEDIEADEEHLTAYEEFRKSFTHVYSLDKTFGKRHKGNQKYMEEVIKRARLYRQEMSLPKEIRNQRDRDESIQYLEFSFDGELHDLLK